MLGKARLGRVEGWLGGDGRLKMRRIGAGEGEATVGWKSGMFACKGVEGSDDAGRG